MSGQATRLTATLFACLFLSACITQREFVLEPESAGLVIHAETGRPVPGAQVRYAHLPQAMPVLADAAGRFALSGRTQVRTILAMPMGGVFAQSVVVQASAPGLAEGYASAVFINGLGPNRAHYPVPILLFPKDLRDNPLHALTRDCLPHAEQRHALQLADHLAAIAPTNPPGWMTADVAQALSEHLQDVLPASSFADCAQRDEAYAAISAQTRALWALAAALR